MPIRAQGWMRGVENWTFQRIAPLQHFGQIHVITDRRSLATLHGLEILHHEVMQDLDVFLAATVDSV